MILVRSLTLLVAVVLSIPLAAQAPNKPVAAKPLTLDWSLVPVSGDEDYVEKRATLKKYYHGKEVTVEGTAGLVTTHGSRRLTLFVWVPAKRGQLALRKGVDAEFHDVQPERFKALEGKKVTVVGIGNGDATQFFWLDKSRLVLPSKLKKP